MTLLLAVCCVSAMALHTQLSPQRPAVLSSAAQLDSLIVQTTYDFQVPTDQLRVITIPFDSTFQRKVYRIDVPPGFSKTTFHHHLNRRLSPLGVTLFGEVEFPEQHLNLNLLYNETVHRTVRLQTDPDQTRRTVTIPRLPTAKP